MALFNRRPKKQDLPAEQDALADVPVAPEPTPDAEVPHEAVPHVGISVSTFGEAPRPAAPRPPAEAPAATESVPGMADNTLLKAALAALPDKPENIDIVEVMRQAMHGHLYVRVRGDARAQLTEGKQLTLAVSAIGDDKFLLAFTGGEALQASIRADGDTATSAVGQPTIAVLRNTLAGPYAGLILDHASPPARVILAAPLIQKALDEADPEFTLKTLLTAPRTPATAAEVADALTRVKVWVAAGEADGSGRFGLAETRTASGERRLEVFSHPLEVIAMRRGDRPLPLTGAQLGKALAAEEGLTGLVLDPAGPWITLDRDELAPVIALAD